MSGLIRPCLRLLRPLCGPAGRLPVARRTRHGDQGGIAVLVAVLLAGGVLLGMGALTMDVGRLYAEREELQSGADAAALAVAQRCARDGADCGGTPADTASLYADTNAKDGTTDVETLCGDSGVGGLSSCPPPPTDLTACVGDPPANATGYVEVRTRSRLPDGSTLLPPILAGTLSGRDGYAGTEVRACARAAWGPPLRNTGLAVTISLCEWRAATGEGTTFWDPPPAVPPASAERVLYLHTTSNAQHCPAGPSGSDAPGGFGWLGNLDPTATCSTLVNADGTYTADPGVSPPQECRDALTAARATREINYMPIFNQVTGTGNGTTYTIAGFAPFVITGYNQPGLSDASSLTGERYCKGDDKCVYGYFTQGLIPAKGRIGGPDLGAFIVTLVG